MVVDCSQGVEAQTLANLYLAMEHDLEILPIINKIDLPSADVESTRHQDQRRPGPGRRRGHRGQRQGRRQHRGGAGGGGESAAGAERRPRLPPAGPHLRRPVRSLPGNRDLHPGKEGSIKAGQTIRFMHGGGVYKVEEVGIFRLKRIPGAQAGGRRGGLCHRRGEDGGRHPGGRHHHRRGQPGRGAFARLPGGEAGGVFLHLPGGHRRLRGAGRRHREAQTERRLAHLSEGFVQRPGLWFPLRFSGAFAPGGNPGAPGAGICFRSYSPCPACATRSS